MIRYVINSIHPSSDRSPYLMPYILSGKCLVRLFEKTPFGACNTTGWCHRRANYNMTNSQRRGRGDKERLAVFCFLHAPCFVSSFSPNALNRLFPAWVSPIGSAVPRATFKTPWRRDLHRASRTTNRYLIEPGLGEAAIVLYLHSPMLYF